MDHLHSDHHHAPTPEMTKNHIFKVGIALNLLFVVVEVYFGFAHNSLALVSDGIHNLSDVFGLTIAWLGFVLSQKQTTKKFSIYAAFINTGLLLITSVWIIYEAYGRYLSEQAPIATTVIVVASLGFVINFFTARLFRNEHQHDLNMKSAYLHLMADAVISLGVVVTGIIIYFKSIFWIDPVVSVVVSVVIIVGTWKFFKESLIMLIGKTPLSVNLADVKKSILQQIETIDIVAIKVWALSTTENALMLEARVISILSEAQTNSLKHKLLHQFRITSVELKLTESARRPDK